VSVDYQRLGITEEENSSLFFSIVNQSSNAVVITDVDKNIIYVNNKFEQLSGYSLNDVIGQNPRILKSDQTPVETYRDMHLALKAGQQWRGIFVNVHRNGNEYVEEAIISPILSDEGKVICFLAEKKDITAQKHAEERVQKLTQFDILTGLPNRAYFISETERLTKFKPTDENCFSILFIDIDKFKLLNDIYGHLSGDLALKMIAQRFSKLVGENDFVARVDGDEFVIVHKEATAQSTLKLANKISTSFDEPIVIENQDNYLDVSIGSSMWPKDGSDLGKVMSRSDLAMHKAKNSRHNYVCYSDVLGAEYDRELKLTRLLKSAIKNGQLSLVYQPKVILPSKKVIGFEALLRWYEPSHGAISPMEFIPIAERHGLMVDIGMWVITQACMQLRYWNDLSLMFEGSLSINLSSLQLDQPTFLQELTKVIRKYKVDPAQIEFEVTEAILLGNPEKVMFIIDQLSKTGFKISIDNFGTGYSSLSYLQQLGAHEIKIDRSFISCIASNDKDKAIVKSIADIGHNLGLVVVAEGVETKQQLNFLSSIGCDLAQGYLFAKPMPAENVPEFLL
jgi:diguanylate cyclase (GGDEF)-like protein/PAS domain S-box-containing protein